MGRLICQMIKIKIKQILILGISFAVIPVAHDCETPLEPRVPEGAEVALSTDKIDYEIGEQIKMTLTLQNTGDAAVVLDFNDGQIYDFAAKELPSETEIWRWSADKAFTLAIWSMPLPPDSKVTYSEIWDQKDSKLRQVEPGLYQIEANLSSQPEIFAEPVQIRIAGQAFETIDKGAFSAHTERNSYVIKEKAEWVRLWDMHTENIDPSPPLPEVDFSSFMVLAVFRGQFNTGGYSTEITKIANLKDRIKVTVVETDMGPGMVLDVLTQPYHIVKTKKGDLPVEFLYIHVEQ